MPQLQENFSSQLFVIASPQLNSRSHVRVWFKWGIISLALAAAAAYLTFTLLQTNASPALTLDGSENYFQTSFPSTLISGEASPRADVFINGEKIVLHENGTFSERIPLSIGTNTISITSREGGGETTITRTVVRN